MYKIVIETEYNTIHLEVDNLNSEILKEVFREPYVIAIYINDKLIYENKGKSR